MIWLLGGYMWLFVHRPFEVWPWLGPLHIERIYMLVAIACWALAAEKSWIRNRLNVAFACFWLVVLVSWLVSPYSAYGAPTVEDYFKVVVFYILVMSTVRTERDLRLVVILFLGAMSLYVAHSLWEYHNGRHVYAMGTARMLGVDVTNGDANSFAGTIVCSLPLVFPLWGQFRDSRFRWLLLGYIGLAVTCILLTGSRMGFVGLCMLSLIALLLSRHRLAIIALLAIAATLAWISLPQDRQNRYLTLIDPSYGPANAQVSAEGRTQGFYDGLALWRAHPALGVGPGVFGIATGKGPQAHNLYGQVLGELGTLGAAAFGLVLLGFVANNIERRRVLRQRPDLGDTFSARLIQSVTVSIVLLLLMGLAGHNLYSYRWLWLGAFQAIALHCLPRHSEALVAETPQVLADGTAGGTCL